MTTRYKGARVLYKDKSGKFTMQAGNSKRGVKGYAKLELNLNLKQFEGVAEHKVALIPSLKFKANFQISNFDGDGT